MNNCLECGKETRNPKFCSLSCSSKTQQRNKIRTPKPQRIEKCNWCHKEFEFRRGGPEKFCSHHCSASAQNQVRVVERPKCLFCENRVSSARNKFCSSGCSAKYRTKNNLELWLANEWSGTVKDGLSSSIRNYLLEQANYKCSICEWGKINPSSGRVPLEIDHIDGDCYNNIKENLRVVCPNCHALSPNYKALNKESGRKYRLKYSEDLAKLRDKAFN